MSGCPIVPCNAHEGFYTTVYLQQNLAIISLTFRTVYKTGVRLKGNIGFTPRVTSSVIWKIKPVQYTTKAGIEKMTYEIVASQILFTKEIVEVELPEFVAIDEETTIPEGNKKKKGK